ncbi:nucleotidyltransferase family protein [Paenibacillus rigui]|uniref:nucleotidyltransferase family protein n=1 Tax=Paenibacillus rigui TaxID=554312 RepID=UPI0015C6927D|nr:nucleotidyltransferase family protein [Paenibacillus rigui]
MIRTLIHALYDPGGRLPEETEVYEHALRDADCTAVSPTVYYLLKQRGLLEQVPPFFAERMKQSFDDTVCRNVFIKHQLMQLLALFERMHIPVIPLKGTRLAERYFGHIGARATTDIDLLVRKHDLNQALQCVQAQGYTMGQRPNRSHFHWSLSKRLPHGDIPLTVELHWGLLREKTSAIDMDEFWEQAVPMDPFKHVLELSDYHTFYHVCLHGWSHKLDSLKYYMDILQVISVSKGEIAHARFLKDTAAHQTSRRVARTLAEVFHYFPHSADLYRFPSGRRIRSPWLNRVHYELLDFDSVKHMAASVSAAGMAVLSKINSHSFGTKKLQEVVDTETRRCYSENVLNKEQ